MSLVKAAPIGFDVGTAPGKADVIFNGTALPGWDGLNINTSRVNILPYQVVFTLYVRWNDGITPNNTFPNNTFANTTIANATQGFNVTSSITSLILFGNKVSISQNQSSGVLHVGVDWEIDLGFQNCISYYDAYSGLVNLTFHFESPTADDVTIQFGKICQWPPVYIAGPPSTPSNLTALAVVNGSAVRGYNYVSPPNVDTDVFYMWLPPNLSYYPYANISLRPSGQPWFTVPTWMSMSWEQSSNTVYPSNVGYTTVTVRYICNDTLPANSATVGVVFDTGCDSVLLLYWTKNCSYGTGIQTPSVFYVDAYHQSVVQGGTPRGLWNDTGYGLPANTHEFEFSVYINDTTRYGLTTLNFTISGDSVDDNPVFIINNGMLTNYVAHLYNGFKQTNNTNNTATTVPVMITCLRAGLGNGSVTFDFGEQYYPVTVYLSYTCTQPYFDVDHVSDDGHIIDRIISSNIPLSWNYISPPTSTQELFRIMLTTQTKDTVQDVNIANIAYNSTVMSAPAVFLDDVPLNLSTWFPLQVGFANTTRVVLTCYDNQPFTTTWVNITVNYGWNQTQRIAFQKTCPYPSSTSSSTLATGYIVLIAVGSFFALFCCTCAGYKYTKQEKRGCDVLPGIGLLRACYQCACPTKEYLTQTDGDDYHGNVPAGKSYQSTDNK